MIIISLKIVNGKKKKSKNALTSTFGPSEPTAARQCELPDTTQHASSSYHLSVAHPVTHSLSPVLSFYLSLTCQHQSSAVTHTVPCTCQSCLYIRNILCPWSTRPLAALSLGKWHFSNHSIVSFQPFCLS